MAIFDFKFDGLFVPVECLGPWEVIFGGNILWQYLAAIFDFEFDGLFVPVECLGPWEVREWTLRHLRLLAPHKKPKPYHTMIYLTIPYHTLTYHDPTMMFLTIS